MKSADEDNRASTRRARFGRKAVRPRDELTGADPALRAELVWLREENARLRMAHATQPGLHQTIARLRAATSDSVVTGPGADLAEEADQLWHVLAEAVAIREGLLSACRDLATAAATLENRLEGLIPRFNAAEHLGEELEKLIAPPPADEQMFHVVEQPDQPDEPFDRTDQAVEHTDQVIDHRDHAVERTDEVMDHIDHAVERTDEVMDHIDHADERTDEVMDHIDPADEVIDLTDRVIDLTDRVEINETSAPWG